MASEYERFSPNTYTVAVVDRDITAIQFVAFPKLPTADLSLSVDMDWDLVGHVTAHIALQNQPSKVCIFFLIFGVRKCMGVEERGRRILTHKQTNKIALAVFDFRL